MKPQPQLGDILHVYNRGNQRQKIFFNDENYLYFIGKMKKHLVPNCDMLAWCLMPNHFHFLIHVNEISLLSQKQGNIILTNINNQIRILLSSYSQAINKSNGFCGNLFQQGTKAKIINDPIYQLACLQYIHNNPIKAGLVKDLAQWKYSSYLQYEKNYDGGMCNLELSNTLIEWRFNNLHLEYPLSKAEQEMIF
jgi:putative transposase